MINEVGNKYGLLTVMRRVENNKYNKACFECLCECGNTIIVEGCSLRSGNTTSCGCRRISAEAKEIGNRYGALTVLSCAGRTSAKKILWNCLCDCGNMTQTTTGHLHSGSVTSCGCGINRENFINERGNIYGKLKVLKYDKSEKGEAFWICQCECGNQISVRGASLRCGNTKSCGCIKSIGEFNINQLLNNNNIKYQTQMTFPDLVYKQPLRYDFALLDNDGKVTRLIEFDGPQHISGNNWHTPEVEIRDIIKNEYAKSNHIPLIRLPYNKRDNITLDDIYSETYLLDKT